jgi:hypothetical protein
MYTGFGVCKNKTKLLNKGQHLRHGCILLKLRTTIAKNDTYEKDLPMQDPKLIRRRLLRRYRKLGLLGGLVFAIWVGYQLGYTENKHLSKALHDARQTISALNTDNNRLIAQVNKQAAKHAVCIAELDEADKNRQVSLRDVMECRDEVALFQHVMAPELSGGLLSVEVTAITQKKAGSPLYLVDLVLLQPRLQKAVISGKLDIAIQYANGSDTVTVSPLPYRFKFFQQATIEVELDLQNKPNMLIFSSDVYQYKRKRESFSAEIQWRRTEERLKWHEEH